MGNITTNKSKKDWNTSTRLKSKGDQLYINGPALVELTQTILDKGATFRFQAKGFSMSPFIKDSDIIIISPITGAPPRLGDVVAFVRPGTKNLVVHRVVGKKEHTLLIMGDRSLEADGLVLKKNILGRVTKIEREGKAVSFGLGPERILIAFLTRKGFFSRFLLPAWRLIRPIVRKSVA